jgi:integrase
VSFYINKDDINSDGSIVLYQRPNLKNPKWQVRLKIPNTKGYKTISTGQVDKQEAIRWSRNHYYELSYKVEKGGSIKSKTFGQVFNEWSDFYRNSNISATTGFMEGQISIVERVFLTLLKSKNIETISEEELLLTLVQHKGFRNKKQIEVSRGTRQTYRAAIMRLYNFAVSKKYVEQLPNLKVSGGRPTGRPHFDKKDYNKLTKYMTRWVYEPIKGKEKPNGYDLMRHRQRFYLQHYILVMSNTGCRVGEMREVTWSRLSPSQDSDGTPSVVISVQGKTGNRQVIAQPVVVEYLQRILDFRAAELGLTKKEFENQRLNEPIFCKKDGSSVGHYKTSFNRLINDADVAYAPDGQKRVIYSLRHTYAVFRLTAQTPLFQLASNMGTSTEMIMRFYGHHQSDDPSYISSVTQSNQQSKATPLSFLDE